MSMYVNLVICLRTGTQLSLSLTLLNIHNERHLEIFVKIILGKYALENIPSPLASTHWSMRLLEFTTHCSVTLSHNSLLVFKCVLLCSPVPEI